MLLNQSVLLKGVNDTVEVLEELCRELMYRLGVKPYYLHHGDLARGMAHRRTTIAEGRALASALRARLSGICNPVYVLDLPDGGGKVPLGPSMSRRGTADVAVPGAGRRAEDLYGNRQRLGESYA